MPPIDPRSFALGALLGPFLWAGAAFAFVIVLAVVGDALEGLVNR